MCEESRKMHCQVMTHLPSFPLSPALLLPFTLSLLYSLLYSHPILLPSLLSPATLPSSHLSLLFPLIHLTALPLPLSLSFPPRLMQTTILAGLRKRLATLFFQYCKTPLFNPEVAKHIKVPQDLSLLTHNIHYCKSCRQYLPSTDFELTTNSRLVREHVFASVIAVYYWMTST